MEYSINIHLVAVQRKGSEELFINKLLPVRVTTGQGALIHPRELLTQKQHYPLCT